MLCLGILLFGHLETDNWYVSFQDFRAMYVPLVHQDLLSKELYSCWRIHLYNYQALRLSNV